MLAALVVLLRSLALICCGHRAVAFENLALRQQLAVFRRTVKRSQLRHRDDYFGCCSPTRGGIGARPWSSFTLTPSCVGIGNGFAAGGRGSQRGAFPAAPAQMQPFGHS